MVASYAGAINPSPPLKLFLDQEGADRHPPTKCRPGLFENHLKKRSEIGRDNDQRPGGIPRLEKGILEEDFPPWHAAFEGYGQKMLLFLDAFIRDPS